MDKEKTLTLLKTLQEDIEKDVFELDGKEFNGQNTAAMFGNLSAILFALTHVVEDLLNECVS